MRLESMTFDYNASAVPRLDAAGRRAVAEHLAEALVRDFLRDSRGLDRLRSVPLPDSSIEAGAGQ
jgi:hypothetical protein